MSTLCNTVLDFDQFWKQKEGNFSLTLENVLKIFYNFSLQRLVFFSFFTWPKFKTKMVWGNRNKNRFPIKYLFSLHCFTHFNEASFVDGKSIDFFRKFFCRLLTYWKPQRMKKLVYLWVTVCFNSTYCFINSYRFGSSKGYRYCVHLET